jgi:hypothetical protein
MPATTSQGITYPCIADIMSAAAWQTMVTTMETALLATQAAATAGLNRPTAQLSRTTTTQNVAVTVATVATYDVEDWDTTGLANIAVNNDRFTIAVNGLYFVTGDITYNRAASTIATGRVTFTRNGTRFAAHQHSEFTAGTGNVRATALVACVATDIIRMEALWTGATSPNAVTSRFAIHLAART